MRAADYLDRFDKAMTPTPGTNSVPAHQVQEANALALAALAAAVLETGSTTDGITLAAAIHHSL